MARALKVRKPRRTELRKLDGLLCQDLHPLQLRRAAAILLYGEGLCGVDLAAALGAHPLTMDTDLRAFATSGVRCLEPPSRGGPPAGFLVGIVDKFLDGLCVNPVNSPGEAPFTENSF